MNETSRLRLSAGTVITATSGGRYTLQRAPSGKPVLGQGANGEVYLARSEDAGQSVAVKFLAPRDALTAKQKDNLRANFKNEILKLRALQHDNLVSLHDSGEHKHKGQSIPFMVLEFLPRSLRDVLNDADIGWMMRFAYAIQPVDALMYLHRVGWIHRDIKPENILIAANDVVKVSDLGIAKFYEKFEARQASFYPESTSHPAPRAYMSPEQEQLAKGHSVQLRPASDAFQLGRVFFEIFTGSNALGQLTLRDYAKIFPGTFRALPLLKTVATMLQQEPAARGDWLMVIAVLSGAFTAYLDVLASKLRSLPRDVRFCLKYAFCDREDGQVTQTVQQRSVLFLCLWYWRWKTGTPRRAVEMSERMLTGPIPTLPRRSAMGCRTLINAMMAGGLIQRPIVGLQDDATLTNLGKDIRDVLTASPRVEHLKAVARLVMRQTAWRLAASWWQLIPPADRPAADRVLKFEFCPCGSCRRYEECCGKM